VEAVTQVKHTNTYLTVQAVTQFKHTNTYLTVQAVTQFKHTSTYLTVQAVTQDQHRQYRNGQRRLHAVPQGWPNESRPCHSEGTAMVRGGESTTTVVHAYPKVAYTRVWVIYGSVVTAVLRGESICPAALRGERSAVLRGSVVSAVLRGADLPNF